jgi:very-short-patch-repair endonuclease
MTNLFICLTCEKESVKGTGSKGKYCCQECTSIGRSKLYKERAISKYLKHPKYCKQCKSQMPYDKRKNKFCSSSCAAKFNNGIRRKESRQKQKETLTKTMEIKYPDSKSKKSRELKELRGTKKSNQYIKQPKKEKIYPLLMNCEHCNKIFNSYSKNRKFCSVKCRNDVLNNKAKSKYSNNPPKCIFCGNILSYQKRNRKTCSLTYTNAYNSKRQTAYLKNPVNRKKYKGNGSQSYMEKSFEQWLLQNNIKNGINGYLTELHFYNPNTNKHGWIDFIFPKLKLIIELDGNHHRCRKDLDNLRDDYLKSKRYNVIRITHQEYI